MVNRVRGDVGFYPGQGKCPENKNPSVTVRYPVAHYCYIVSKPHCVVFPSEDVNPVRSVRYLVIRDYNIVEVPAPHTVSM